MDGFVPVNCIPIVYCKNLLSLAIVDWMVQLYLVKWNCSLKLTHVTVLYARGGDGQITTFGHYWVRETKESESMLLTSLLTFMTNDLYLK
jgi:hypothetical protein